MTNFQRDMLAGQVIGAPFASAFKRSDGKTLRLPMQVFGRPVIVLFWSNDEQGLAHLKDLAESAQKLENALAGRMEVISFNLDDLPDAGESIVRSLGVDWPCMYLPGGRKHPVYQAYARRDPLALQITPTGQAALVVKNGGGAGRFQIEESDAPHYESILRTALEREWSQPGYCAQLISLSAGDFLVFDPEGDVDPVHPPELKAIAGVKVQPLERSDECVPSEKLQAIQDCFLAPPMRYLIPRDEILAAYSKTVELCRKTMEDHSDAPDLWVVRNRLIISLMGLWKVSGDMKHLEAATEEAKVAIGAGFPDGGDVVARFCLAREALCRPNENPREIIDRFVVDSGVDQASGLELAAAAILAMDAADRFRYIQIRKTILERHADNPMLWIFSAFLVDRAHQYWLF